MNPSAAIYFSVPALGQALATYVFERMPWLRRLATAEVTFYLAPTGRLAKDVKRVQEPKKKETHGLPSPVASKMRGAARGNSWHALVSEFLAGRKLTAKEVCDQLAARGESPAYATVYSYLKRKAAFDGDAKRFYLAAS